MIETMDEAC